MTFGQVLGLIAIIVGVIAGVQKQAILGMDALVWFVLAIALVVVLSVGAVAVPFVKRADG